MKKGKSVTDLQAAGAQAFNQISRNMSRKGRIIEMGFLNLHCMMNRRHFLGATGLVLAGTAVSGPMLWKKPSEARVYVILTGGIWHQSTDVKEGWKVVSLENRTFRRPSFPGKKVRAKYGLSFETSDEGLAAQLESFRNHYLGREPIELVVNGESFTWNSGTAFSFSLPAHGWEADAASLEVPLSTSALTRVVLLHGTDVAHFDLGKYVAAEEHLGKVLPHFSQELSKQGRALSMVCFQGRDAQPNAMGGLDHATEEAKSGGWWLEMT
jgi:hypothetical protein